MFEGIGDLGDGSGGYKNVVPSNYSGNAGNTLVLPVGNQNVTVTNGVQKIATPYGTYTMVVGTTPNPGINSIMNQAYNNAVAAGDTQAALFFGYTAPYLIENAVGGPIGVTGLGQISHPPTADESPTGQVTHSDLRTGLYSPTSDNDPYSMSNLPVCNDIDVVMYISISVYGRYYPVVKDNSLIGKIAQVVTAPLKAVGSVGQQVTAGAVKAVSTGLTAVSKAVAPVALMAAGVVGTAAKAVGLTPVSDTITAVTGSGASPKAAPVTHPADWDVYKYINANGQLMDAYGNISPNGPVAGTVYYNSSGAPVDYQGNPILADANGKNIIQKKDGNYYDMNGTLVYLDSKGVAVTLAQMQQENPGWMTEYNYFNAKGQLTDPYGNVSSTAPTPGALYYDASGNPVDFMGNPVVGDASTPPLMIVEYNGRLFDLVKYNEIWIDQSTGQGITPQAWMQKYYPYGAPGTISSQYPAGGGPGLSGTYMDSYRRLASGR